MTAGQNIETRLADVQYKGMERVNPEYLKQRAQVKPGDSVDTAEISAEARRMSALQEFESVEYRLTGDPASPTLEWWPQEKRWGPDYLKFDLGLYGSEDGDLGFVVYAKHTRTWLNALGAEWRNEVQLGLLQQPVDQLLSAARRRAAILRRTEVVLDAIVGGRLLRQRTTGALQVQRRRRQFRRRR